MALRRITFITQVWVSNHEPAHQNQKNSSSASCLPILWSDIHFICMRRLFFSFCFAFYEGSCKSAHVKTLLNIHVYRHLAFLSSEDKKGLEENHQNWKKNLVLTVISTTIYIRSSFYFFLCMLPALVSCTDYCVQQLSNISDMKYTEDIYCSVGTNNVKWSG